MKHVLIIMFIILSLPFYAQTADENPMGWGRDKEQEMDKDLGELMKQQSKSLWSMDIDPYKYRFNIPILEEPRQATYHSSDGFSFEQSNASGNGSQNSGSFDFFKKQKYLKSKQGDNALKSAEKMAEWKKQLAERAEANRHRIEAENQADRERGRQEYYNRMGKFHAHNAARDQWMATEGIEHLKDVHVMDWTDIPVSKKEDHLDIMSDSAMANLLKPQEEEISIEVVVVKRDSLRDNKSGEKLNNGSEAMDFFGKGGYNISAIDEWDDALNNDALVMTNSMTKSIESEYVKELLFSKKEFDISTLNITTLPGMGCVILLGDSVVLLDSPALDIVEWNSHESVEEIVVCGSRTFGKQGKKIIELIDNGTTTLCEMVTGDFKITGESEKSMILFMEDFDLTIINRLNINSKTYDELLRITQPIDKVVANSNVILALQGNKIVDILTKPKLFYSSGNILINDLCMCRDGLLVATDKDVILLHMVDHIFTFSQTGAKRIWCDGEDIYLQDITDNLYRYSKKN